MQGQPLSAELLQRIFDATIQHRVHFTNNRGEECSKRIFLDFLEPLPSPLPNEEEGDEDAEVCFRFDGETILELLEARFITHASCNCEHSWLSGSDPYDGIWHACKRYVPVKKLSARCNFSYSCLDARVLCAECSRSVTLQVTRVETAVDIHSQHHLPDVKLLDASLRSLSSIRTIINTTTSCSALFMWDWWG